MTRLARTDVASTSKRNLILSSTFFYILLWVWLPPCTPAQDMEGELEPLQRSEVPESFTRQGTSEERITIAADDVLDAVAMGRSIDIRHAVIDGDLDIGKITDRLGLGEDGRSIVPADLRILSSEIRGYTIFSTATLKGSSDFSSATFIEYADFGGVIFSKSAEFSSANFVGDANFTEVTFRGNAAFTSTTFSGDANFPSATFSGYAYFRLATFSKNVDFTDATLSGATDFIEATFTESARFLRTSVKHPASFQGIHFRENTVLAGLWNNVFRRVMKGLPERTVTDFSQFDTVSIMDGSSNPYLKRYIDDEQWIKSWRESAWWREPLFVVWEATSHCGRSIGLWACWAAFIVLVFATIYSFMPKSIAFRSDKLSGVKLGFRGCLYYSVVTLTTLGYGDITPLTNPARFVAGTEVCVGYVMLGGLVSIFANKLARRS